MWWRRADAVLTPHCSYNASRSLTIYTGEILFLKNRPPLVGTREHRFTSIYLLLAHLR